MHPSATTPITATICHIKHLPSTGPTGLPLSALTYARQSRHRATLRSRERLCPIHQGPEVGTRRSEPHARHDPVSASSTDSFIFRCSLVRTAGSARSRGRGTVPGRSRSLYDRRTRRPRSHGRTQPRAYQYPLSMAPNRRARLAAARRAARSSAASKVTSSQRVPMSVRTAHGKRLRHGAPRAARRSTVRGAGALLRHRHRFHETTSVPDQQGDGPDARDEHANGRDVSGHRKGRPQTPTRHDLRRKQ